MQFFLVLALLIAVVLVLFAVQNASVVTVSFLLFDFEGSLAFILITVFAAGFLSGILISVPSILKKNTALREQKREMRQLEEGRKTMAPHKNDRRTSG